jgi:hypothetical protein
MPKHRLTFTMTLDLDLDEIAPMTPHVWLYQLLNRINYEHEVKSVTFKGRTRAFTLRDEIRNLALREREDLD